MVGPDVGDVFAGWTMRYQQAVWQSQGISG